MDASLLQDLGLAILLEVADLEPREKEVTVDFALMQIALTNQMETLREVVAVVLSGAMSAEFPVDRWKHIAWVALAEESCWLLDTQNELQAAVNVLQHCEFINVVIANCHGQEVWNPYFPSVQLDRPTDRERFSTTCQIFQPTSTVAVLP